VTDFRISTERLVLRSWRDEDIGRFTDMVLAPQFSDYLSPIAGPAAARDWVMSKRSHFDRHGFGPWVVELAQTREFIGCIGLSVVPYQASFTPAVEIAWRVAEGFRRCGYATEAARAALADGFGRLRLREIVANTSPANLPSRRVMTAIGMKYDLDFEHPLLPIGHPLRQQVLYRATAPDPTIAEDDTADSR
jgi:RimJ/RimL family protein N-acetyltransferase